MQPSPISFFIRGEPHIFGVVLNTARASFSRTVFNSVTVLQGSVPSPRPFPGIASRCNCDSGFAGITAHFRCAAYGKQDIYTVSDDVSYMRGKHSYKFES